MKEARELQTLIDQLEAHIVSQEQRLLQEAVLAEREACAKLCLEPIYYGQVQNNRSTVGGNKYVRDKTAQECAAAIRARGEK